MYIFSSLYFLYVCNNISLINKSKQKKTKPNRAKSNQVKLKPKSHLITSHHIKNKIRYFFTVPSYIHQILITIR